MTSGKSDQAVSVRAAERSTATGSDLRMRGVVQRRYGGPEELRIEDVARPRPRPGEVVIRMSAAAVTRGDWHVMRGRPYLVRAAFGLRRPRRAIPGMYASGIIVECGEGATRHAVGDAVFGSCSGAFAEFVRMREDACTSKPGSVSHAQAASSLHGGFAALQAIRDKGHLKAGDEILLIGAAGAVGCMAIQLAKAAGARVTAVCRGEDAAYVTDLGAEHVVDYTKTTFAADATARDVRYDLIFDLYGGHAFGDFRRSLRPRGKAVLVAVGHGNWTGSMHRALWAAMSKPFRRKKVLPFLSLPTPADLNELRSRLDSGELRVPVAREYPLMAAGQAFRDLETAPHAGYLSLAAAPDVVAS